MCFDKKSSSSSTQNQTTNTTNRDERIGAAESSKVLSVKEGGSASQNVTEAMANEARNVFSVAPDGSLVFEDTSPELIATVFDFAKGVTEGAGTFARETQAQFSENKTEDLKEISSQFIKYAALVAGGFFLWKAMA